MAGSKRINIQGVITDWIFNIPGKKPMWQNVEYRGEFLWITEDNQKMLLFQKGPTSEILINGDYINKVRAKSLQGYAGRTWLAFTLDLLERRKIPHSIVHKGLLTESLL